MNGSSAPNRPLTTDHRLLLTVTIVTRRGDGCHSLSARRCLPCPRVENASTDKPTYVRRESKNRAAAKGGSVPGCRNVAPGDEPKGGGQFSGSLVFRAVECRNRTYTLLPGSACRYVLLRGGLRSNGGLRVVLRGACLLRRAGQRKKTEYWGRHGGPGKRGDLLLVDGPHTRTGDSAEVQRICNPIAHIRSTDGPHYKPHTNLAAGHRLRRAGPRQHLPA